MRKVEPSSMKHHRDRESVSLIELSLPEIEVIVRKMSVFGSGPGELAP